MIALEIEDVKPFMTKLFIKEDFDELLLEKAEILTCAKLELRGRRNQEWYDTDQWETLHGQMGKDAEYVSWGEMKSFVFTYIKGKQSPQLMRISFKISTKQVQLCLEKAGLLTKYREKMPDLLLQVRFEKGKLQLVTGIAWPEFTMDKSVEKAWDAYAEEMMRF